MNPFLASLAADLWAMEPVALERFLATIAAADINAALRLTVEEDDGEPYAAADGVATIPVSGILLKSVPPLLRAFGFDATGYTEISAALAQANADPSVSRIVLAIDSPGGSVAGVQALADQIHASAKPVQAHISDLGASAAYWLASQARAGITAERGAMVGSIGVFRAVVDKSAAAAAAGIKVHVLASGAHKGVGVPGSAIEPEQLAELQRSVDAMAAGFVADIARGRGRMPTDFADSADGRVFSAADAKARGLIDDVTADPLKEYHMSKSIEQMAALIEKHPAHAVLIAKMSTAEKTVEADIVAAIAKIDADAALAKSEADAKATADHIAKMEADAKTQGEQIAALTVERDDLKSKHDALSALKAGAADAVKVKGDAEMAESITRAEFERDQAKYAPLIFAGKLIVRD